jgi:hypothetical protein
MDMGAPARQELEAQVLSPVLSAPEGQRWGMTRSMGMQRGWNIKQWQDRRARAGSGQNRR